MSKREGVKQRRFKAFIWERRGFPYIYHGSVNKAVRRFWRSVLAVKLTIQFHIYDIKIVTSNQSALQAVLLKSNTRLKLSQLEKGCEWIIKIILKVIDLSWIFYTYLCRKFTKNLPYGYHGWPLKFSVLLHGLGETVLNSLADSDSILDHDDDDDETDNEHYQACLDVVNEPWHNLNTQLEIALCQPVFWVDL